MEMTKKEVLQAYQDYQKLEELIEETTRAYCKKIGKSVLIDSDCRFEFDGVNVDVAWETYTMGNTDFDGVAFPADYLWEGVP